MSNIGVKSYWEHMWLIFPIIWVIKLSEVDKRWISLAVFLLGSSSSESQSAFHPPQSTSTIAPAAVGEGTSGKRAQFTQLNTKNLLLASQKELWIAWLFHKSKPNMHTVSNSIQATYLRTFDKDTKTKCDLCLLHLSGSWAYHSYHSKHLHQTTARTSSCALSWC